MAQYNNIDNWDVVIETWERDQEGHTIYTHIIRQEQEYQDENGDPVNDPKFPNKWVDRARHNDIDPKKAKYQSAVFIAEKGDPNVFIEGTIDHLTELAKDYLQANPPEAGAQERIDKYVDWVQVNDAATIAERNQAALEILINGDLDHPNLS